MKTNRTSLGFKNEEAIMKDLLPIFQKWAKKLKRDVEDIQSNIAYCWKENKRQAEQDWQDYMSRNEIGPYGGR